MLPLFKKSDKGFTLIELMVTISIIGILSAIALVSYTNFLTKSRDQKRQSDLKVIQSALEQYHADQNFYPCFPVNGSCITTLAFPDSGNPLTSPGGNTYLNQIPTGPNGDSYNYKALPSGCNDSATACSSYCLSTTMESLPAYNPASCLTNGSDNYYVTPQN